MAPQKFVGSTSREVLQKVKQALGDDALIVSNRPFGNGIEVKVGKTAPREMGHVRDVFSRGVQRTRSFIKFFLKKFNLLTNIYREKKVIYDTSINNTNVKQTFAA